MKVMSAQALEALESGRAVVAGAVKIVATDGDLLLWSGNGDTVLDGETYAGVGDRGMVTTTGSSLGGAEQGLSMELSGVPVGDLPMFELAAVRRAPCSVWRLIYDGAGTTRLDERVWTRGKIDQAVKREVPGGMALIRLMVEGAARAMGRSGARRRTDADQRLTKATDGFFRSVAWAAEKVMYWGGERPQRAAGALPNTSVGGWRGIVSQFRAAGPLS